MAEKKENIEERLPENAKDILEVENTLYKTYYTKKYANKQKYEPKDPKKITAFMPGTILDLEVKTGTKVKKGEFLLILEAMKMKNRIFADQDGTIKKVHVKVGERVPKGTVLIEMK